jgi:crotonobetainyl-CoA:carnitine CoA-transferase CaiB-like acyl-CoA transferase
VHLYVSADPARAAEQLARRQELAHVLAEALRELTTEETIEVLAEALRAASGVPDAATLAARLAARGVRIEARLVQRVFDAYGLVPGKKTSGSTFSRRRGV